MASNDAIRRVILFLVFTFGLSTICYVLVNRNGGIDGGGALYVMILMWIPGLVALAINFFFQRNLRGMGWGLGRPVYYVVAYALPLAYGTVAYGATWLLHLGSVNPAALGDNFWQALAQGLTVGAIPALILAAGEEIGWQGLLVPQLARVQPFVTVAISSGIIWGLWHLPVILTGGYNSGTPAWFAISCFMISITGVSFAYVWLRQASGSVWPAVVLHGMHNQVIQSVFDVITVDTGNTHYFTTEFGLMLLIESMFVAVIFWRLSISHAKRMAVMAATA
jgi:membrane protease YdiL (CAAX protease family)